MRRLIMFPRRDPRPARKPRRRAWPSWLKPALRFGASALALALIAGSATWLWTSGRSCFILGIKRKKPVNCLMRP